MTVSMTGFAARKGQGAGYSWAWDIRSVNGKGLDLRLRVPDWVDGLELALRAELAKALGRGNVSLSLKVTRDDAGAEGLRVNAEGLAAVLAGLKAVEDAAMAAGVTLAQATAADVLAARGVLEMGAGEVDTAPLRAAILADLPALLAEFGAMRAGEGAALARVIANAEGFDEGRVAQELAMLAVKNDVTEEIDRLTAHVAAARALMADPGQVGRKFDFLVQEFLREANTLCSKAQSLALTRIGLDLKTVIDQMREQVQNVE